MSDSTQSYIVSMLAILGLCISAALLTNCSGSSEPAQIPPVVFGLCKGELIRLGADPARAEELCRVGGELLEQELAKLRERASVAAVPCAPVGVGGGGS